MDDALCFSNLPPIGPNTNLEFPDDCHLLVDLGYHCRYPLMTTGRLRFNYDNEYENEICVC